MAEPKLPLYLDHAATTPLSPAARDAMLAVWDKGPANPHSNHHQWGWQARSHLEDCNRLVWQWFDLDPLTSQIIWTSGATESNNMVLRGVAGQQGRPSRIVTVATEHDSVLQTVRHLAQQGWDIEILPVDSEGQIDPQSLLTALQKPTGLVSIMAANNETGILHPIPALAAICRDHDAPLHCDASQVLRFGPDYWPGAADFVTLSAHKAGGPGGIGLLLCRLTTPAPLLLGGGQQNNLRSGTQALALVAGFCAAIEQTLSVDNAGLQKHCQAFEHRLQQAGCSIIGQFKTRLPGFTAMTLPGITADEMMDRCPDLAFSSGSACASTDQTPSHVLKAMGMNVESIACTIRLSAGHSMTGHDYAIAADHLLHGLSGKDVG